MKNKFSLIFIILIGVVGCLVPGAPHTFNYTSTASNSCYKLKAVSFPNDIEYIYQPCGEQLDSIFLFEPKLQTFKKMEKSAEENTYHLRKREGLINANLTRMRKVNFIAIKKYRGAEFVMDTLNVLR